MRVRALFLLLLGLSQVTGDLLHWQGLGQAALATDAAPAPQVFCRSNGVESFACRYYLDWTDQAGTEHQDRLGPSVLDRIPGPLARRSMYLRILTGNWDDPHSMTGSVKRYALCGPLLAEMGIDRSTVRWPARIRIMTPGVSLFPEADFPLDGGCP
ncbi:MAG TPA: hypothetical protein VHE12_11320 [bacterium]|nr:hypothetical protein [bacterium]